MRAIETCRLEKGYVYWSAEIGPDYDPLSAGLAWAVDLAKDFIGKSALLEVQKSGPSRRLCLFTVDGFAPLLGGETILKDGKVVGQTASCGFGHAVGQTIAFGWLPSGIAEETVFEIEAHGKAYPSTQRSRTLYDPKNVHLLS
jgi:4-methylaminobutanoate oxidase (formaldehyde-forming)